MIELNDALLGELGLGRLPANLKTTVLRALYAALEARVGNRLAAQMTDAQLDEFEAYFEQKDDQGAFRWLEQHFPDYKAMTYEEYRAVVAELSRAVRWLVPITAPRLDKTS